MQVDIKNKIDSIENFVQNYCSDYWHSDYVMENDDLHKILECEINGDAERLYNEIASDLRLEFPMVTGEHFDKLLKLDIERRMFKSDLEILTEAVECFINKK